MASLFYPFKAKNGQLVVAKGALELKHKIIYLLRTRRFTRVMNQDFGLPDQVFRSSPTFPELEIAVTQQIKKYFPEVEELNVTVSYRDHDSGKFTLTLEIKTAEGSLAPFTVEV